MYVLSSLLISTIVKSHADTLTKTQAHKQIMIKDNDACSYNKLDT